MGGGLLIGKWCIIVMVLVVLNVQTAVSQRNLNLYEGSSCRLYNGVSGTCKRTKDCPGALELIRRKIKPEICSYIKKEAVVCCEKDKPKNITRSVPPVLGSRIGGEKSKKACEDWTNEIRPQVIPLIHDGVSTAQGEFPHMALLGYREPGNTQLSWRCGGALISDQFVLTAAHCFTSRAGKPIQVRLGEYDLSNNNDNAVDYRVGSIVIHPQYQQKSWYHDLALIKLGSKVRNTAFIYPACLYTNAEEPAKNLIITGWGATTSDGRESSNILQKGSRSLELVPLSECNRFYRASAVGTRLTNGLQAGMFCAGDPQGSVDTCQGDSGGPIQVATEHKRASIYHILGVTSGGSSICGGGSPAIYTKVSNYLEWIEGIVWP